MRRKEAEVLGETRHPGANPLASSTNLHVAETDVYVP